jgi:hypothetical protein
VGGRLALCEQGPKLAPKGVFPGLCPRLTSLDPLLGLAQVGSPTAQAIAATAQVQRRNWKMLMSRFRLRINCFRRVAPQAVAGTCTRLAKPDVAQ